VAELRIAEPMASSPYLPNFTSTSGQFSTLVRDTHLQSRWYAVYTAARHEKRVAEQLGQRRVTNYCPVQECIHKWNNRKVKVQLPYFPNYLFVNFAYCNRLLVLQVPGVVRIVESAGEPIAVPDEQIVALRTALELGLHVVPEATVEIGRRVRIRSGPLEGTEGVLLRKKGKCRLVVSIQAIMRSFVIEVDRNDLQAV
jgi:transcription antitermination factor NusG